MWQRPWKGSRVSRQVDAKSMSRTTTMFWPPCSTAGSLNSASPKTLQMNVRKTRIRAGGTWHAPAQRSTSTPAGTPMDRRLDSALPLWSLMVSAASIQQSFCDALHSRGAAHNVSVSSWCCVCPTYYSGSALPAYLGGVHKPLPVNILSKALQQGPDGPFHTVQPLSLHGAGAHGAGWFVVLLCTR